MNLPTREFRGLRFSRIGLGCSRIGSLTGATKEEGLALIERALEAGITFFDTASSYGQGDSERLLSLALSEYEDIIVASKIGKVVPLKARITKPAKAMIRKATRLLPSLSGAIRSSRGAQLPTNFEPPFLERQLGTSLHRLDLSARPLMMLHSPDVDTLQEGSAIDVLAKARAAGRVQLIGASVDDLEAAKAVLADERIDAIQCPFNSTEPGFADWVREAKSYGKLLVAREIFGGVNVSGQRTLESIKEDLKIALSHSAIDVVLVGTSRLEHLNQIISCAEGAC